MKRENTTRLACLFLSLALSVSLLAGCGGFPAPTEPPATTSTPTSAPTVPTTEPVITEPTEYIGLTMELPAESSYTTIEDTVLLQGMSDPSSPLTVNGVEVERDAAGAFSYTLELAPGSNEITVSHKEETAQYAIERRYAVQFYEPCEPAAYLNNATIFVRMAVRAGSELRVTLGNEEIPMKESYDQLGSGAAEGFVLYTGTYILPQFNKELLELGEITYTVTCDGITEVYTSGQLTAAARVETKFQDAEVTPSGGQYINVGSGLIVELVDGNVETFNGRTTDDYSNPTYNYLPKGTVDYGYQVLLTNPEGGQYRLLRCGVRVYESVKNTPYTGKTRAVDCYTGYLPDHNEIHVASLAVEDHHTYLTLDCLWKAPFFFDMEPQDYLDPSQRRFTVENFDASYIDITFCYANQVTGSLEIPQDNPLFSSAELIANESDYTLRLHLKKAGGFYGWDAYYNENDQLCFKFLNPVTVTKADNAYGVDLTGVRIMLDVGHGGGDIGAAGVDSHGLGWVEKIRNLDLAMAIRAELESIGATVIMNRTDDSTTTQRERIQFLREQAPDYCLCIHHNSNEDPNRFGYETGYFTTFTQLAADHIHDATMDTGIYHGGYVMWFFYYVSRQTVCPIVLTENGYMSNVEELEDMLDPDIMQRKAEALVRGIANYYLEINGLLEA